MPLRNALLSRQFVSPDKVYSGRPKTGIWLYRLALIRRPISWDLQITSFIDLKAAFQVDAYSTAIDQSKFGFEASI